MDVGMEEFRVAVRREPLGVVALITPWNYPLLMATVSSACACVGVGGGTAHREVPGERGVPGAVCR